MEISGDNNLEFANNTYNNFMDLFFNPEIVRRKKSGLLNDDFILYAAQVIFFPDGKQNIVRLNQEVSAEVKLKKGVDNTIEGFWPKTKDVELIKLNESQYLNCGHATLVLLKDSYQLTFDFQYNKVICKEHLQVAGEFLKTSKYALDNNYVISFIDTSFSTIELLAKTNLLLETNQNISGKTTHKTIKSAFNNRLRISPSEFEVTQRKIFNQLSDSRRNTRYLEGKIHMNDDELNSIYTTIEKMYNNLSDRIKN